ncbi:MAG: tol-pal system protein YbgF [Desulfobacula sp.]|nr:tol-pal system protein YbgF [Desulfobacula sp.]
MKKFLFFVCVGGVFLVSGCVSPDQYKLLENRIAVIENESQQEKSTKTSQAQETLQGELDNSAKISREEYADIKYTIQQMKTQFNQIEGKIEEINHNFGSNSKARQEELEKKLDRLDNAISRNYEKILKLEKYMGFEPTNAAKPTAEVGLPPVAKPEINSEQESYDLAKIAFDEGDKENARIQFENFINKYPDSKNADNARFWIADSYYAEKWYEKAILEYQKVLETYPDSNKTAAARLKQGYSFAELGEKANARLILKELIKRHPDSNEAKYAREKLKSLN